ncbi:MULTISPECIES: hypothetical protein [unclassified Dyella]|uniref:hypothetical protein n=1 Tax=Dyella sp. ASV21 TaxID=2795114 RepID=UPI0018EC63E0|nr:MULTISPECIES: hypothetical protein [unclassified Dyella]
MTDHALTSADQAPVAKRIRYGELLILKAILAVALGVFFSFIAVDHFDPAFRLAKGLSQTGMRGVAASYSLDRTASGSADLVARMMWLDSSPDDDGSRELLVRRYHIEHLSDASVVDATVQRVAADLRHTPQGCTGAPGSCDRLTGRLGDVLGTAAVNSIIFEFYTTGLSHILVGILTLIILGMLVLLPSSKDALHKDPVSRSATKAGIALSGMLVLFSIAHHSLASLFFS